MLCHVFVFNEKFTSYLLTAVELQEIVLPCRMAFFEKYWFKLGILHFD